MNNRQKTIIISLSSPVVFKNLFFFTESLFDRIKDFLKKDGGVRFVVVLQSKVFKFRRLKISGKSYSVFFIPI